MEAQGSEYVREQAELWVRAGFLSGYEMAEELVELAEEEVEDDGGDDGDDGTGERGEPLTIEQAAEIVAAARERLDAEEATWPDVTDFDRLEQAFAGIEERGVVARMNFTCCRSCGLSEIGDEVEEPGSTSGFVFFHFQGTEAAVKGHGLTLYYGGFDGTEQATVDAGWVVKEELARAGLVTDWAGDPGQGISISPFAWRRRG
jgi:hypothetical protein